MKMNRNKFYPVLQVLLASALFGASAPLSKALLAQIEPVPLAAFLYLGSGLGLFLFQFICAIGKKQIVKEASLKKKDIPWLIGAIIVGGVAAPILLMTGLTGTPASTASLLLNFEGIATTLLAFLFFKENIGRQVWGAIGCITLASVLLSWNFSGQWGFSTGTTGILLACFCWGLDNNFTRNISAKNPFAIVAVKGIAAGLFSLLLSLSLHMTIPGIKIILLAMVLGFFCYGISIVLFVYAFRALGRARTSSLFGTAPFVGAALSFLLFGFPPDTMFYISLPIMAIGAFLLLRENHIHKHIHPLFIHEHSHTHSDGHHAHLSQHESSLAEASASSAVTSPAAASGHSTFSADEPHVHEHVHEAVEHEHPHSPDIHHRHSH